MIGTVMLVMVLTVVVAFLLPLLGRRSKASRATTPPVTATVELASTKQPEAG